MGARTTDMSEPGKAQQVHVHGVSCLHAGISSVVGGDLPPHRCQIAIESHSTVSSRIRIPTPSFLRASGATVAFRSALSAHCNATKGKTQFRTFHSMFSAARRLFICHFSLQLKDLDRPVRA
eukprot:scaffold384_cov238-Pinguiococcus_pyrenoidosus.AAC.4